MPAVQEAARLAFLAHSRPRRQAIEASEGQEENPLFIPSDDQHQHLQPFSIRVQKIKIAEEIFGNADVTLSHKPAEEILQFHVREQPPGEGDSKLDMETKDQYNLMYSTSKKQVALERIRDENNHVLDIHLHSTREGEVLIERLKALRVIDCPHA